MICITPDHDHPPQFSMESLAQELLEAIIDHVSPKHVRSCSLVARRWRKRCQQRFFREVAFTRELDMVRWYTKIPQDPNGIPSYALHLEFTNINYLRDIIIGSVLKCFSRVKILTFTGSWVPSGEVNDMVSSGVFGRELTSLILIDPLSKLPALMSLILSFPNLKELTIHNVRQAGPLASAFPGRTWQKEPLQSLQLSWLQDDEIEFIVKYGITSRRVDLYVDRWMIEKMIACSSETMSELVLWGTRLLWSFVAIECC